MRTEIAISQGGVNASRIVLGYLLVDPATTCHRFCFGKAKMHRVYNVTLPTELICSGFTNISARILRSTR